MSDIYLIYLLFGCLCLLFLFLVVREAANAKQTRAILSALANITRARAATEHELRVAQQTAIDQLKDQSAKILSEHIKSMEAELRDMQIENDTRSLRLDRLEEKINEYFSAPSAAASLDVSRAISLYNTGYNIDEIARELRTNQSEVALVLRLNNLEPRL
ncbi:hypothetical protein FACS189487_07000 [Campylobacterota bacterium]|nr:hypothetical protein FACS189487_07000 [Campylobacterota bacterium]